MKRKICKLLCLLSLASNLIAQDVSSEKFDSVKAEQERRIGVIKRISPTVVCIFGNDPSQGGGSGVLIHHEGYAVTNFHVVQPVGLKGKGGLNDHQLYDMETLGIDPGGDLAVVKLNGKRKFEFATMKNHRTLSVGDFCMALGNPFLLAEDYTPTVTFGVVSGLNRYQTGVGRALVYGDCIQIDSSINPGNSGGPLFTDDGFVVGINGRGSFEERGRVNVGLGYAISSLQVVKFLPDLFSTKICLHGTLNARFRSRANDEVFCTELNPNGNAFKAGLKAGDIILSLDGLPIKEGNTLVNYVSTYPANWPVKLLIQRSGEKKEIWFRLDALEYETPKDANPQAESVFGVVGEIRDKAINAREAKRIALESGKLLGSDEKEIKEFACKISKKVDDKALDFLLRINDFDDISVEDVQTSKVYKMNALLDKIHLDGKEFNDAFIGRQIIELAQPIVQWYLLVRKSQTLKADYFLEGGDLAKGRPSFRINLHLELNDKKSEYLFYFDVMNDAFELKPSLLKASVLEAGVVSNYGFVYDEFQKIEGGLSVPKSISLVRGFDEHVILNYLISEVKTK